MLIRLRCGLSIGLSCLGTFGPSSIGLIIILRRPTMGLGPIWKIGPWFGPQVVFGYLGLSVELLMGHQNIKCFGL